MHSIWVLAVFYLDLSLFQFVMCKLLIEILIETGILLFFLKKDTLYQSLLVVKLIHPSIIANIIKTFVKCRILIAVT